ncbi:MAG: hypothetical protein QXD86_05930 [Candidatus Bathyarchaeia archaeon]
MVRLETVNGRKGEGDKLVRVWAYGEIFTIEDLLKLLQVYFESEDSAYPIERGGQGRAMLMKAILDVYTGIPLKRVLRTYRLERKKPKTFVIGKGRKR